MITPSDAPGFVGTSPVPLSASPSATSSTTGSSAAGSGSGAGSGAGTGAGSGCGSGRRLGRQGLGGRLELGIRGRRVGGRRRSDLDGAVHPAVGRAGHGDRVLLDAHGPGGGLAGSDVSEPRPRRR